MRTLFTVVSVALALGGCGDPSEDSERDAQVVDAARTDSGGELDASREDDSGTDASLTHDSGSDAGPPDPCHIDVEIPADCTTSSCRQIERRRGSSECVTQGYLEYTPPGYGDGARYPLLVFLHGIGENGDGDGELANVARNGIPRLIGRNAWDLERPFIVLSPQHFARPDTDCHTTAEIQALFDYAKRAYDVDPSRIYLTGLSCGAIGGWNYLAAHTDTQGVAAAVLIAGDGRGAWSRAMCDLGRVPIWAFHGDDDPTVNVAGTRTPITNLMTMCDPVPDADMVIYPGVRHDSWTRTYDGSAGHDVYAWLLEHTR
ncbi:hypothetical protein [Sandaracinus amylolyticus]|uniref:Phospholipase/carboxylesterase/thioesterase domain-containing protein n=1 Tax=Sandaracinus amylolyticus TaxID=927083 RepID=A0A0F6W828_9BACT|nr:hypothetical protein [Sandaracinus amylolyticus]AKF09856.1 hypothetical protein DB32_007005 [Sandaracinus amylolyticus]